MYRQKNYTKCLKVPKTPKNSLKRAESTKNLQKEAKTDQSMDQLTYFFISESMNLLSTSSILTLFLMASTASGFMNSTKKAKCKHRRYENPFTVYELT